MRIVFKIYMRISKGTCSNNWNFLTHLLLTRTDKEGDNQSAWPDSKKFQPQDRKECNGKRLSTVQALNVAFPITSCFHSHCLFCFLKARKQNLLSRTTAPAAGRSFTSTALDHCLSYALLPRFSDSNTESNLWNVTIHGHLKITICNYYFKAKFRENWFLF